MTLKSTAINHARNKDTSSGDDPKIVFVYDWLVNYNMGGGEKVLAALMEIWPAAPTFTLVHDPRGPCAALTKGKQVNTSLIQYLPGAKNHHRLYLPLMPYAVQQLDLNEFDLVISCSHAFAHGIRTHPGQLHINYIFTPFRYAWELTQQDLDELGITSGMKGWLLNAFLSYFRVWDHKAAQEVDYFIANSNWTAKKVGNAYQRSADVIYSPVEVSEFNTNSTRSDYYVTVSRLVPYKRIDVITDSFSQMPDKQLLIIGEGPEKKRLEASVPSNIKFLGYQSFEAMKSYLESAKGFVYSAVEDFGIAPIEAQAAGTPVIGFRKGGLLETVVEGETGIFYESQTPESLIDAVNKFESSGIEFNPARLHEHAQKFNKERFKTEIQAYVIQRWEEFNNKKESELRQ
jgi:glycosyltransferase involved in cell wall biosynthesis